MTQIKFRHALDRVCSGPTWVIAGILQCGAVGAVLPYLGPLLLAWAIAFWKRWKRWVTTN